MLKSDVEFVKQYLSKVTRTRQPTRSETNALAWFSLVGFPGNHRFSQKVQQKFNCSSNLFCSIILS